VLKCVAVGAPITPGSRVAGGLKRREDNDKYHKERAKQPEMKRRRIQTIIDNYKIYDWVHEGENTYQKGLTDPKVKVVKNPETDHRVLGSVVLVTKDLRF